jgi:hypothetical protein
VNSLELVIIDEFDGSTGGNAVGVALDGEKVVENFVDFLGEQSGLLLLQGDTYDLSPCAYLQIERARPGEANGADDDPIRPGEFVNACGHTSILGI